MTTPVRVALVGSGTWARDMHAPTLAAGPETVLTGVWSRRSEAAAAVATPFGVPVYDSFDALLDDCEAVAFAVPPDVQASLAPAAAAAGKAVLLEKPLALDLSGARAVADAVAEAGVPSIVVLTKRFHPRTTEFLDAAAGLRASGPLYGVDGRYWHGGLLGGEFAHGWRQTRGALDDLGPHLLDLATAVCGPVATVRASGDPSRYVNLDCRHESGAVSSLSLSAAVRTTASVTRLDVAGREGAISWDTVGMDHAQCWPVLRAQFAAAIRSGAPVLCDVATGLTLSVLLDAAWRSLASGARGAARHLAMT